jgi:hypothetical protein
MDDERDYRNDDEEMNRSGGDFEHEQAENPNDEEDERESDEHGVFLPCE